VFVARTNAVEVTVDGIAVNVFVARANAVAVTVDDEAGRVLEGSANAVEVAAVDVGVNDSAVPVGFVAVGAATVPLNWMAPMSYNGPRVLAK
jgi:hypothetical protein